MKAKRKLSELKEDECIMVTSIKEGEFIIRNTRLNFNDVDGADLKNNFVFLPDDETWWDNNNHGKKVVFASDFIKPKKSKLSELKKRVKALEDTILLITQLN